MSIRLTNCWSACISVRSIIDQWYCSFLLILIKSIWSSLIENPPLFACHLISDGHMIKKKIFNVLSTRKNTEEKSSEQQRQQLCESRFRLIDQCQPDLFSSNVVPQTEGETDRWWSTKVIDRFPRRWKLVSVYLSCSNRENHSAFSYCLICLRDNSRSWWLEWGWKRREGESIDLFVRLSRQMRRSFSRQKKNDGTMSIQETTHQRRKEF